MLQKYFTWILTLIFDLPESRDLLDFYCRASIVYNIMLLTLRKKMTAIHAIKLKRGNFLTSSYFTLWRTQRTANIKETKALNSIL